MHHGRSKRYQGHQGAPADHANQHPGERRGRHRVIGATDRDACRPGEDEENKPPGEAKENDANGANATEVHRAEDEDRQIRGERRPEGD